MEEKHVKLPHKASLSQEMRAFTWPLHYWPSFICKQVHSGHSFGPNTAVANPFVISQTPLAYSCLWVLLWIEASIYNTLYFNLVLSMSNIIIFLLHVQGLHVLLLFPKDFYNVTRAVRHSTKQRPTGRFWMGKIVCLRLAFSRNQMLLQSCKLSLIFKMKPLWASPPGAVATCKGQYFWN